jgi:hypothetical protein
VTVVLGLIIRGGSVEATVGRVLHLAGRLQHGLEHVDEAPARALELLDVGRSLLTKQLESLGTVASKVATRGTLDGAVDLGYKAGRDLKATAVWIKEWMM